MAPPIQIVQVLGLPDITPVVLTADGLLYQLVRDGVDRLSRPLYRAYPIRVEFFTHPDDPHTPPTA